MNLTLSNQYRSQKPHPFIQLSLPTRSNDKAMAVDRQQCSGFFNCCMNGHAHLSSHQAENARLDLRKMGELANQNTPKRTCSEQKKQKISVSLNHKSTQHCTPDRKKISRTPKHHHSEQVKAKTEQATHSRIQLTPKSCKTKTQPKKDSRHREQSIHHIRQSANPFKASPSSKRQTDARSKLTLSSAFKSQLRSQKPPVPIPQQFSSDHLLIQDSFMTAKLANIYGDRNSELQLFPKSNIVFYNQLMADQQLWKAPHLTAPHDVTFSYNEGKADYKDVSIQKDIPEECNEKEEEEEPNFRARIKERKWIGEYAKTIKTFNESEMRSNELNSEAESIVLEKGHNHFTNHLFPITPITRGSFKQYKQQPAITRGYSSLKQDPHVNITQGEHRFKKLISQTIEEDLHDSQNNFSVPQ